MPLIDPVTMTSQPISPPESQAEPRSRPIELRDDSAAQLATHLQPVLLLSTIYLGFSTLVADPVAALSWGLIPLAAIKIAFCTLSLPVAGTKAARKVPKVKGVKKSSSEATTIGANIPHLLLSLTLTLLLTPALFGAQILLGAPLTTHLPHTLLSSLHLSLLTLLPLIYAHGIDGTKWIEILSGQGAWDEVYGGAAGALVGGWLGAVPIPLDWDREWQRWPVTVVVGMYLGAVAGQLLGALVEGWGRRTTVKVEGEKAE